MSPGDGDVGVAALLRQVTHELPGGGEERPGQVEMAQAVAEAIDQERHLVVQAGTGTGKSLAYLVPAVRSGRRVVVATATKALQDQLATKELPFLAAHLSDGPRFSFAVLKGRSNYLCRQRAAEVFATPDIAGAGDAALFAPPEGGNGGDDGDSGTDDAGRDDDAPAAGLGHLGSQIRDLIAWSTTSATGDRAELDFEPHPRAWAAVSVTARDCPGAFRCPSGTSCFAEWARTRASTADVVVVNTHLYATHVASGGTVLPDHDVLILDECHAVEDIMTAGLGLEVTAGRVRALGQGARGLLAADDGALVDGATDAADRLERALRPLVGRRLLPGDAGSAGNGGRPASGARPADTAELGRILELTQGRVRALAAAVGRQKADQSTLGGPLGEGTTAGPGEGADLSARRTRILLAAGHLVDDLAAVTTLDADHVAWVEASGSGGRFLTLRRAPIEVGPVLAEVLWPEVTAVLTSATVPPLVEDRLGLPRGTVRLDVGSPFPYRQHAVLYCAAHLPDRRSPDAPAALHDELEALITAAGGRALALFTSWRAMQGAVEALRPRLAYRVLAQNDLPKAKLLEAFGAEESSCLFATVSFWQGVDVPGATLSLVTIDRLPFPRPDDPLLEARRARAGDGAFRLVDLPRATTLLAQGAGRLIRSSTDTGVVAVLDPRLAKAGYRRTMLEALPPMRLTTKRAEVLDFLRSIAAAAPATVGSVVR
ncbi:MAG TPA: ATP-dependent DNA helicase [Acidimicrobiales bacterium]|nr:ATP-dependent DNA helicase [Acidimicrobiales bacterium]